MMIIMCFITPDMLLQSRPMEFNDYSIAVENNGSILIYLMEFYKIQLISYLL